MVERLQFLVLYVGSAAMVALLAVCLSSPRVAMFTCDGAEQCELAATLATEPSALGDPTPASLAPTTPVPTRTTVAAAH